jgi:hypothetical protein
MGRVRRRGLSGRDPMKVAKMLPIRLRTLEAFFYLDGGRPHGYRDYTEELTEYLSDLFGGQPEHDYVGSVAAAAGTSLADWLKVVLPMDALGTLPKAPIS